MEKLISHHPKRDGVTMTNCTTYTISTPSLSNSDILRDIAKEKGYIYAMCGGVPRLVLPEEEEIVRYNYTSYYRIDEENKKERHGGIFFNSLIENIMRGKINAMIFAFNLVRDHKIQGETLAKKIDQYVFHDYENPLNVDDGDCAASLMIDWGGQESLFAEIDNASKCKEGAWGSPYAESTESYYDFLIDELSPFITALFFTPYNTKDNE